MKTLRLLFPRWQGGITPSYYLGSEILNVIVPKIPGQIERKVDIDIDFDQPKRHIAGIQYYDVLKAQNEQVRGILKDTEPEAIVTLGGDCSVSQLPFEYLLKKYGQDLGIVWLDAHTDTVAPGGSDRLHEMPLGDLLGQGQDLDLTRSEAFVQPDHVLFAGVIADDIPAANQTTAERQIMHLSPEDLRMNPLAAAQWASSTGVKQLAIHWDLDVLDPQDYRSILTAEPYTTREDYDFAVGKMKLTEIADLLESLQNEAQIVGLTISEPVNWDADHLRQTLLHLNLFH